MLESEARPRPGPPACIASARTRGRVPAERRADTCHERARANQHDPSRRPTPTGRRHGRRVPARAHARARRGCGSGAGAASASASGSASCACCCVLFGLGVLAAVSAAVRDVHGASRRTCRTLERLERRTSRRCSSTATASQIGTLTGNERRIYLLRDRDRAGDEARDHRDRGPPLLHQRRRRPARHRPRRRPGRPPAEAPSRAPRRSRSSS